jgi:hypothetical protein
MERFHRSSIFLFSVSPNSMSEYQSDLPLRDFTSIGLNQIFSFLHSGRRPRYIRPLVVFVLGFGSSGGSDSRNGDAETFLLACGSGSESVNEKYSSADWPSVIF